NDVTPERVADEDERAILDVMSADPIECLTHTALDIAIARIRRMLGLLVGRGITEAADDKTAQLVVHHSSVTHSDSRHQVVLAMTHGAGPFNRRKLHALLLLVREPGAQCIPHIGCEVQVLVENAMDKDNSDLPRHRVVPRLAGCSGRTRMSRRQGSG